ncbi:MAG: HlyD family efflux transporter periplasmic adaptor subunit [Granulosicoccus sp.]|nr:HlyD family efflux transporter periplasmic adaptor subunit [Granulosicoccus sp.]
MVISESLIRSWFALQQQLISGLRLAYVDLHGPGVLPGGLIVTCPAQPDSTVELSLAAQLAQRSGAPVTGTSKSTEDGADILRIAQPVQLGRHASGAMVVEIEAPVDRQAAVLQLLKWGESWLNLALVQCNENPDLEGYKRLIQTGLAQTDYRDTVTVVLALLRIRTGCTRVALGHLTDKGVKLEAVSDQHQLDTHSARVRSIESAMAEALHVGKTVCWPGASVDVDELPQHRQLIEAGELSGVCSVPLMQGMRNPLVVCFEYAQGFSEQTSRQAACEEGATIVAPLLELYRELNRPWLHRFTILCRDGIQHLVAGNGRRVRVGLLASALFLVAFSLSTGDYRVPASATLEGVIQRAVIAPFDSYILEADARAGHEVAEGDLLARLDDRELVGERRKLRAEQGELDDEHRQAVATLDHGRAKILAAQLEQARARLSLVQDQLSRTELRAPLGGLVISGDWSRSLGAPVQRGDLLYQVARLNEYRIVMQVGDRDIAEVEVGQRGTMTLSALPRETVRFTVNGISKMAAQESVEPSFRVEASLEDTLPGMRPGMEGVAKIEVGERRRWWIWTHELTDWMRLQLWQLWP